MKAYRFNDLEMERMISLQKTFSTAGFLFDGVRHPAVYYDDLSNLDVKIQKKEKQQKDISPEYFGAYMFDLNTTGSANSLEEETRFDAISKEGEIILFKDKIERKRNSPSVDSIRFVVLMHEWGHWVTHWPLYSKFNWDRGFNRPIIKTLETIAQLVAYWACESDVELQDALTWMSPKINGKIDETNPYGIYAGLVNKDKSEIIHKIGQLRKVWFIHDEKMVEFLKAEQTDVIEWLKQNNYSLATVSEYQANDFVELVDEANNLDREVVSTLFDKSDLSRATGLINRISSTNY